MALTYKQRYQILLKACQIAIEDCDMALDGRWDKSDEGFDDTKTMLEDAIENAGGDTCK